MSKTTVTDISPKEWSALKTISHLQHRTIFDGKDSGTATTDTPGLGKTVVRYEYDPAREQAEFTITARPDHVPEEVIWFALGATVAHVTGAPHRTY